MEDPLGHWHQVRPEQCDPSHKSQEHELCLSELLQGIRLPQSKHGQYQPPGERADAEEKTHGSREVAFNGRFFERGRRTYSAGTPGGEKSGEFGDDHRGDGRGQEFQRARPCMGRRRGQLVGDQATHRHFRQPCAEKVRHEAGDDPEDGELEHDRSADLSRSGTDRPQQRHRARSLSDRQGDGAGDDEQRDEHDVRAGRVPE